MSDNYVVLYGRGASHLNEHNKDITLEDFANGEIRVVLNLSVREKDVIYIQSFGRINGRDLSINDLLMESYLTIDAIKRAGCHKLCVIFPIMPYSRQDRKHRSGVSLSAQVVCRFLQSLGVDRFITFDLHADQIQGFMNNGTVFDHLSLLPYICHRSSYAIRALEPDPNKLMMCSTDAGSVVRTSIVGDILGVFDMAIISKTRNKEIPNQVASARLIGEVKGKTCILVDDMVDTAGSLDKAYQLLMYNGAERVIVMFIHGVLSKNAVEKLGKFDLVILSDTIPHVATEITEDNLFMIISIKDYLNMGLIPCIKNKDSLGSLMRPPSCFF